MIIYGARATQIAREQVAVPCTNCNQFNSIDLYVHQRYAHVFWIPFIPLNRTGASECRHCAQVLRPNQMPPALSDTFTQLKKRSRLPLWTFIGIAALVCLIGMGVMSDREKEKQNLSFIQSPKAGDILEVKLGHSQFTVYRIEDVMKDSVLIRPSNYEATGRPGFTELKKKEYSEGVYRMARTELKAKFEKGDILGVDRH